MTLTYRKVRSNRTASTLGCAALSALVLLCSATTACGTGSSVTAPSASAAAKDNTNPTSATPTKEHSMTLDLTQIKHAESIWADSLKSGDAKLLATIIGPSFTFIGPDGQVEDRKAYLAGYEQLPALGIKVQSIDMDEVEVRVLGDVAIAPSSRDTCWRS
jgi:hypothetical protein